VRRSQVLLAGCLVRSRSAVSSPTSAPLFLWEIPSGGARRAGRRAATGLRGAPPPGPKRIQRFILRCRSARSAKREALLVLVAANSRRADISGQQFASSQQGVGPPPPNRRLLYQAEPLSPPRSVTSFARAVPRRPRPATAPPCVFRSPTLFSACSQHTGIPACVWWFCRP
jgi:hypothetical protein